MAAQFSWTFAELVNLGADLLHAHRSSRMATSSDASRGARLPVDPLEGGLDQERRRSSTSSRPRSVPQPVESTLEP